MPKPELTLLHRIELEVYAEGEAWMRKRLQERLQELADAHGEVSPPQPAAADSPTAKTRGVAKRRRRR